MIQGPHIAAARRIRGGVVVIRRGKLAAIERHRGDSHYFLLPGGSCEAGETPRDAAVREGFEELGLRLRLHGLLAVVTFRRGEQHYFDAEVVGGRFGTGAGPEMASPASSPNGSHRPVWLELGDLDGIDLRPVAIRDRFAGRASAVARLLAELTESPLHVHET